MKIVLCLFMAILACGRSQDEAVPNASITPAPWTEGEVGAEGLAKWSTKSGRIFKDGREIVLKGINWFGFETPNYVVHGLWTGRTMDSYLQQVKGLGFNALRIPVSPGVFSGTNRSSQGKERPLDNLKDLLSKSGALGIHVLLDLHTCDANMGLVGNPTACPGYTVQSWHNTLVEMTKLSKIYYNVLGIDLFNEPYKLSWSQWRDLSSEAAKRVLSVNPGVLIFVEGVGNHDTDNGGYGAFWGENLVEAEKNPLSIPQSQLVFSPHVYGPSVAHQTYFDDPSFPKNMPAIWNKHFGYLTQKGYPVILGEFGGRYTGKDQMWQDAVVGYMISRKMTSFFYWSLNPNSGDTGGILNDDWTTVNQGKVNLLKRLMP